MKSFNLILFLTSFIIPIYTIKFGFLLKDDANIFNDKFVAFGSLPADLTSEEKFAVSNDLNKFYKLEMKKRSELESPTSFQVTLVQQTLNSDGERQVALTGELSNFLANIRVILFDGLDRNEIWKKAKFYWDPIIKMSREAFDKAPKDLRVTLLRAAFDNHDFVPLSNEPIKSFADLNPNDLVYFEHDEYDDEVEDENRFTILEFFTSTGSIQDPAADLSPKNSIRSKLFNRKKRKETSSSLTPNKASNCCNIS